MRIEGMVVSEYNNVEAPTKTQQSANNMLLLLYLCQECEGLQESCWGYPELLQGACALWITANELSVSTISLKWCHHSFIDGNSDVAALDRRLDTEGHSQITCWLFSCSILTTFITMLIFSVSFILYHVAGLCAQMCGDSFHELDFFDYKNKFSQNSW